MFFQIFRQGLNQVTHQFIKLAVCLLMLSCLSGCGNTGALYLPDNSGAEPENTES